MAIFSNPENALKRAEELINVGQKQDTLQELHGLITSKSYRSWQKPHEKIMFRYVEICVESRLGRFAKDGLIQYRNACQQVNVNSLEAVIKHFLDLATEKAEQALTHSNEEALDVVDDLEADKTPEYLQLSIVNGEKEKNRSDCEQVTPWFKFLWETYKTVLEISRNNSNLEVLYAMTAHKAFQFCKQYKRPTEFRRLCEMIRNHLTNPDKHRDQKDRPDLTSPETLQLYQDTRFEQLEVATELGLGKEAFRSVEDIYGLMCMVKKRPKSSLLGVYYSKLTEIFWNSSSNLYHAYAWLKLFSLQKHFNKNLNFNKNFKDLQLIASSVILAALSVPSFGKAHGASHLELENEKECDSRMANLIDFNLEPKFERRLSRSSLLSELVTRGVLVFAAQEVKDLYNILEHEFHPLDLGSKIKPLLDRISKLGGKLSSAPSLPEVQLSQYVPSLEKLATLKLLQQVSRIYQTVRIQYLAELVPFFDFSIVEKISVDAVKNNSVSMKVDHVKGVVIFGNLGAESDGLRDRLTIFAETMNKVRAMLFPAPSKASNLGDKEPNIGETVEKEHERLIARKSIIEKRKEEQERQQLEMDREEEQRKLKLLKLTKEAEQKRLAKELEERIRQRILREIEEREFEEAQACLENTEKRLKKGKMKTLLDGEKVTKQTVMERAMSEKREMEKKLQKLVKTMDYLERAKREEAAPLIEAAYQQRLMEEKESYDREQEREIELSREHHERLVKMRNDKGIFQERVISHRPAEFERLRREKEERIGKIIRFRKHERDIKRKQLCYLKSEEEQVTKLQEEEEEACKKHEEAEKRRNEETEQKAKLDEVAEYQRQRELELEEEEERSRRPTDALPAPADAAAPSRSPARFVPSFRRRLDLSSTTSQR